MYYADGFILPETNCVAARLGEAYKCLLIHHAEIISLKKTISCRIEAEELNEIFRDYVSYITGEICTQETFQVNLAYDTILAPYKVEAFINDVNQDHTDRYSIRGIFLRTEDDV